MGMDEWIRPTHYNSNHVSKKGPDEIDVYISGIAEKFGRHFGRKPAETPDEFLPHMII